MNTHLVQCPMHLPVQQSSTTNLFFLRWQLSLSSPSSEEEGEEEEELESEEEEDGRPVPLVRSTLSAKSAREGWCS